MELVLVALDSLPSQEKSSRLWRAVIGDSAGSVLVLEGYIGPQLSCWRFPLCCAQYHVSFTRQQISALSEGGGKCSRNRIWAPIGYGSWGKPLPSCECSGQPFDGRTVVIGPEMAIQSNTYAVATDRQSHVLGFLR